MTGASRTSTLPRHKPRETETLREREREREKKKKRERDNNQITAKYKTLVIPPAQKKIPTFQRKTHNAIIPTDFVHNPARSTVTPRGFAHIQAQNAIVRKNLNAIFPKDFTRGQAQNT